MDQLPYPGYLEGRRVFIQGLMSELSLFSRGGGNHPGKLIEEVRQDDLRVSDEHLLLRGIVGEGNKRICRCVGNVLLFAKDEPCFLTGNAHITPGPLFYSVTTQHDD